MSPQQATGQMLLIVGGLILGVGAYLYFGGGFGALGRLPGDVRIEGERGGLYFPIVSSIVVSIVLTILLNAWFWWRGRG